MPVRIEKPIAKKGFQWRILFHYRFFFILLLALAILLGIAFRAGHWLITNEQQIPSARWWTVVLEGQSRDCERTDFAAQLYKANQADKILLSSLRMYKTRYSAEFLQPDLVEQGIPNQKLYELRNNSYSTIEEAAIIIPQFRLLGVDTVQIVTSNFHTQRTQFIFNKLAKGHPVFIVLPANYAGYDPDSWWVNRNSIKIFLSEWFKFIVNRGELLLSGSAIRQKMEAESEKRISPLRN